MASWGKQDVYTDAPLWALLQVNKAPTLANMGEADSVTTTKLFQNEEADDFITGATIGLFNVSATEIANGFLTPSSTLKAAGNAHQGWVLSVTGSGGRANRVQNETLVCLTSNT